MTPRKSNVFKDENRKCLTNQEYQRGLPNYNLDFFILNSTVGFDLGSQIKARYELVQDQVRPRYLIHSINQFVSPNWNIILSANVRATCGVELLLAETMMYKYKVANVFDQLPNCALENFAIDGDASSPTVTASNMSRSCLAPCNFTGGANVWGIGVLVFVDWQIKN